MDIILSPNRIFIACGYTDMRKSIDGLSGIVAQQFQLNVFDSALFRFCGRRRDRFKALLWRGDGFVLLYKRLESGRYQCPIQMMLSAKSTLDNIVGCWKVLPLISPRQSPK